LIVDTSAVVSVLNDEPYREQIEVAIAASSCEMSSISLLEASIVLMCRRGEESLAALDTWLEAADINVVAFTPAHARLARNAYARFGKGRHASALNFGDCAAYALAVDRNDELLFVGADFPLTDVRCAKIGKPSKINDS
jgi:ribonuclease VapC